MTVRPSKAMVEQVLAAFPGAVAVEVIRSQDGEIIARREVTI
jgi:hypothetical protein